MIGIDLPFEVMAAAALALMLALAAVTFLRPMIQSLADHVPVIGPQIAKGAQAAENGIRRAFNATASTADHAIGSLLMGLAQMVRSWLQGWVRMITSTHYAIEYLSGTKVGQVALAAAGNVAQWASHEISVVRGEVTSIAGSLRREIGLLDQRVGHAIDVAIPGLRGDVEALGRWVGGVAIPGLQEWTLEHLRGLRDSIAEHAAWIAAAAVTLAFVVEEVAPRINRCRNFLDWLCGIPKDFFNLLVPAGWGILGARILDRAGVNPETMIGLMDDVADSLLRTL